MSVHGIMHPGMFQVLISDLIRPSFAICSLPVLIYLLWRLWTFTIIPYRNPDQPRELPYWIPFLGHGPAFVKDGSRLISKARTYFADSDSPFFLTVGGEKLFFVTSPDAVADVYKDLENFSFDETVKQMTMKFGVSPHSVAMVYRPPGDEIGDAAVRAGYLNPTHKPIAHLNNDYLKKQLNPGEQLDQILDRANSLFHERIVWDALDGPHVSVREKGQKSVDWFSWSRKFLLEMTTSAFFGDELLQLRPSLPADFLAFDKDNYKLWYQIPGSSAVLAAKDRVVDAFEMYISLPETDTPSMAPVIRYYTRTCRAKGLPERDTASILSMLYFGQNTNTAKLTFWAMAHILHNPHLRSRVQDELSASSNQDQAGAKTFTTSFLQDNCPLLNAVLDETLRLHNSSSSVRTTTRSVVINGKHIPHGSRLLLPFRELHHNTAVWGSDPAVFDADRFLSDPKLSRSKSYRPFGGGVSLCPGRFFARAVARLFLALVLSKFDVRLDEEAKQVFPEEDKKPSIGLGEPRRGCELVVIARQAGAGLETCV